MKSPLIILAALASITAAHAGDVTLTLNGGKVSAPSCETDVQATRHDGVIELYLNGGKYCNFASATNNGAPAGSKALPKIFKSIAGDSIILPESAGENNYVVSFSGNGRSDTLHLQVKNITTGPKIDVKINNNDAPSGELAKCGGTVSMERSILGDVTVTFNGIDSCQFGSILQINGAAPTPPVTFNFDWRSGGSMVRTIGNETIKPGKHVVVYKLWSRPTAEGAVIRETVEVTIQ